MEPIAIIADDLTGASDTAMQFCKFGFRTTVIVDFSCVAKVKVSCGQEVFSINASTRSLMPTEAYKRVKLIIEQLLVVGIKRFYKKIDSTLRGHPGVELEAAMDALKAKLALVVPAFPANNRSQVDGYLVVSSTSSGERIESKCHVPTLLQSEIKKPTTHIDLETVRRGGDALLEVVTSYYKQDPRVLIIDAETDDDLDNIAYVCSRLPDDVLLAGAAGLAAHLPPLWGSCGFSCNKSSRCGLTLIVIGSRNPTTLTQMKHLMASEKTAVVKLSGSEILFGDTNAEILRCSNQISLNLNSKKPLDSILLTVDTILDADAQKCSTYNVGQQEAIASALGRISLNVFSWGAISSILVGGGDTAYHLCQALCARQINLITEILPGIPLGRLAGGICDGLLIVTKAGGFGPPDALLQVMKFLEKMKPVRWGVN